MTDQHTTEQKLLEILDDFEFKLSGDPKHWGKTLERQAIDDEAVSKLEALLLEERI